MITFREQKFLNGAVIKCERYLGRTKSINLPKVFMPHKNMPKDLINPQQHAKILHPPKHIKFYFSAKTPLLTRADVSNSSPRTKFDPDCNYNWPVRSYNMCIRAGPRFILHLISNLISYVFVIF